MNKKIYSLAGAMIVITAFATVYFVKALPESRDNPANQVKSGILVQNSEIQPDYERRDIEEALLGEWRASTSTMPYIKDDWGFINTASDKEMREYGENEMPLWINKWKIILDGGKVILQAFFWKDDVVRDSPNDTYEIVNLTDKKLEVKGLTVSNKNLREELEKIRSADEEKNKDFSLTGKNKEEICARILTGEYLKNPVFLPIECEKSIHLGEEPLRFAILPSNKIEVRRSDNLIFALPQAGVRDIDDFAIHGPFLSDTIIALADVTYDGYDDLSVRFSSGAYNVTYDYYAYDPATKTFDPKPILSATNPSVNEKEKTIASYNKGRGYGDIYTEQMYLFEAGAYILVERVHQDMVGSEPEEGYIRTTEERQNGKMVEVKREKLSEEEITQ